MTINSEEQARAWVASRRDVSRETMGTLEDLVTLVREETIHQNLIAPATVPTIWQRHVVDSLQLIDVARSPAKKTWLDVGSGGGFPGLVIACLGYQCTLVEPRKLRADFLSKVVEKLGLSARVAHAKVQALTGQADAITARAVASPDTLIAWAQHMSHPGTTWILPAGRSAHAAVAIIRQSWQGEFHVEPSLTDASSGIVVGRHVQRRRS